MHCYHYSRYENWSRKSGEILAEKIRDSDLPEDKKNTNIPNLRSIVSQIGKYILPEEINTIKDEALRSAERDYLREQENESQFRGESKWKEEERWVLIWAIEYAQLKHEGIRDKKTSETWRKIFFHFCPEKKKRFPSIS